MPPAPPAAPDTPPDAEAAPALHTPPRAATHQALEKSLAMEVLRGMACIAGPMAAPATAAQRTYLSSFFDTFFPGDGSAFFLAQFETLRRTHQPDAMEALATRLRQRLAYPERIFCLLTLYGFATAPGVASPEDPNASTILQNLHQLEALLEIRTADQAFMAHHFGVQHAAKETLAESHLLALRLSDDRNTADVHLPLPGLDVVIFNIQSTYCVHKHNDRYPVAVEGIPLRQDSATRISQHVDIRIEDHVLRHHDLLLHFRNTIKPLQGTLFVAMEGVEVAVSTQQPEAPLARIDIHGSRFALTVLSSDALIMHNGQAVHTACTITLNDMVHCNGFRLDPREFFHSLSCNQDIALPPASAAGPASLTITNDMKGDVFIADTVSRKWTATLSREEHAGRDAPRWRFAPGDCPYLAYVDGHARPGAFMLEPGQALYLHNTFLTPQSDGRHVNARQFSFRHLVAEGLSRRLPHGGPALDGVSLSVDFGEMACIMGPSGSGKTTLLKTLCGVLPPHQGTVTLDNTNVHRDFHRLKDHIGYVPQEDLLLDNLTVWENLYYHARLRFPELPRAEVEARIAAVLAAIRLSEKASSRVGSLEDAVLSGGERKRLHIGLELLSGAAVFFVDEPTSGLSSSDSDNIMELLADIALSGKIVVAVIHQPSSRIYKRFDKVCILDHGGRQAYFGTPAKALAYFHGHDAALASSDDACHTVECPHCKRVQPESILQTVEESLRDIDGALLGQRKYTPEYWRDQYRETVVDSWVRNVRLPISQDLPPLRIAGPTEHWTQFYTLTSRTFRHKWRDRANLGVTFLAAPLLALGSSFILKYAPGKDYSLYTNDLFPSFLFVAVISVLFLAMTNSVDEIIDDAALFLRERMLHIPRRSYLASKMVVLLSFAIIQNLLFAATSFAILEVRELFWQYLGYFTCISICGLSLGLCISATPRLTGRAALNLVPLALIPQIILGGALIEYERMNRDLRFSDATPIPEICQFMPSRWAYEGLIVLQETNNAYDTTHDALADSLKNFKYQRETLVQTKGQAWFEAEEKRLRAELEAFRKAHKYRYGNKNIRDAVNLGEQRRTTLLQSNGGEVNPMFVRRKPLPMHSWLPWDIMLPTPFYNALVLLLFSMAFQLIALGLLRRREAVLLGR